MNKIYNDKESFNKKILLSGLISSFLFMFISILDGITRVDYGSTYHTISHLSLGSRSWLGIPSTIV